MKIKEEEFDVGVIIGRFQVPKLHQAHIDLINTVVGEHKKIILFLGVAAMPCNLENPLDFEMRKNMIQQQFQNINILYIKDTKEDEDWSKNLDSQINDLISPHQKVVLYGSRDSFIRHYNGKYKTKELIPSVYVSGTELRQNASKQTRNTEDYRCGVIRGPYSQYPKVFPTVDCIIYNNDYTQVLLGRKSYEKKFRFIGGFAEPGSKRYQDDMIREIGEEVGIKVCDIKIIGDIEIDDWRVRNSRDSIHTVLFEATYLSGDIRPADDIEEAKYFDIDQIENNLVEEHLPLWKNFRTTL